MEFLFWALVSVRFFYLWYPVYFTSIIASLFTLHNLCCIISFLLSLALADILLKSDRLLVLGSSYFSIVEFHSLCASLLAYIYSSIINEIVLVATHDLAALLIWSLLTILPIQFYMISPQTATIFPRIYFGEYWTNPVWIFLHLHSDASVHISVILSGYSISSSAFMVRGNVTCGSILYR